MVARGEGWGARWARGRGRRAQISSCKLSKPRAVVHSTGETVNTMVITLHGDNDYHADHGVRLVSIGSLSCTPQLIQHCMSPILYFFVCLCCFYFVWHHLAHNRLPNIWMTARPVIDSDVSTVDPFTYGLQGHLHHPHWPLHAMMRARRGTGALHSSVSSSQSCFPSGYYLTTSSKHNQDWCSRYQTLDNDKCHGADGRGDTWGQSNNLLSSDLSSAPVLFGLHPFL